MLFLLLLLQWAIYYAIFFLFLLPKLLQLLFSKRFFDRFYLCSTCHFFFFFLYLCYVMIFFFEFQVTFDTSFCSLLPIYSCIAHFWAAYTCSGWHSKNVVFFACNFFNIIFKSCIYLLIAKSPWRLQGINCVLAECRATTENCL